MNSWQDAQQRLADLEAEVLSTSQIGDEDERLRRVNFLHAKAERLCRELCELRDSLLPPADSQSQH